ncbi:hypothetical protein JCM11491_005646 [Sporobolomyces phaffii]
MDLNAASQAQLAAFLLAQHQTPPAPVHTPPHSTPSSPFDPVQALATLQWGSMTSDLNHSELDGWLQEQLNALTQLPLSLPNPPAAPPPLGPGQSHSRFSPSAPETPLPDFPAPAQPHAFPPISSSRFHPYDRHQTKPERPRWHSQPVAQQQQQNHAPSHPPLYSPPHTTFRQPVLYPPDDSPSPLILAHSQATTPRSVPTPMETSSLTSPSTLTRANSARANSTFAKRRRTRSLPSIPTFSLASHLSSGPRDQIGGEPSKSDALETLFDWMDQTRWNLSSLLTALSEVPPQASTSSAAGMNVGDVRTPTHRRRIQEFLNLDSTVSAGGGEESWESRVRRWKRERKIVDTDREEKGADEIVRLWEEQGGLGRKAEREKGMEDAVKELHLNGGRQGPVAGVAIRSVINRYHEAYNESQADIARLDAALSRPPSPHLSSAPREPAAWSGHLVVPPLQADLLSHWLMSPGRPNLQEERSKGSIEADHMRIYSSLSPLDLHARGAEICRAILARDESTRALFGQHWDSVHFFVQGPSIAPVDTAGFSRYDDYSLWHHALMCYLQLCVRYPAFKESKEAHIVISPDLPPPLHPTALETSLIDRLLRSHWDYLRLYLLQEHGGLLRSAVRGFEGVKLSRFDLLSVVGDTIEVIEALKKSRDSSDRILPYDASVSQIRNAWRQRAFWDPQASWVAWSAATTHFLELSALNKEWAQGVKDLPGIEGLLGGSSSKTAASQALR